jgi:SSS family solute:Na+ symporter
MVGVGVPVLMLLISELISARSIAESIDYVKYREEKDLRKVQSSALAKDPQEIILTKKQNHFGLKIIAFSLLITALILFALCAITPIGKTVTGIVGIIVLLASIIPWLASRKVNKEIAGITVLQ